MNASPCSPALKGFCFLAASLLIHGLSFAAVSSFDTATVTDSGIEDEAFLWNSSDFSSISLEDAAAAGVGSGQVLQQAAEVFESPSGLTGHFWTEFPSLNVADLIVGDRVHIQFDFKTATPADLDNPGFDRIRWGIFEGLTANSAGVGNIFSSGATAGRGKIAVYREAYNDDDSPRFFTGTAILSDPSLALGADTDFAADDVTINGYLGDGEPHTIDILIEKTATGLEYTFDIDNGVKVYTAEVPLTTHVFTRFNSFQFYMRDAISPDSARGLSIDNFTIEVSRAAVDSMVESGFDGATVDGESVIDGNVNWGSSTESDLSVSSAADAGFGSGDVLTQANVNYPDSGRVGYFWVDLGDLGVTDMKVGETVQVMFTFKSSQPLDLDNPGFDRLRWGLFEEIGGNEWGVGNVFSPGATASRGKVNYFRETFNDQDEPGFFSNVAVLSDNSLVFGADTEFAADDVGINAYLNDGEPKHFALTFTKTVAGMHIVTNIDQGTKVYEAVAPAWVYDFTRFSAFQFYMRAAESANSSKGLHIEDFSAVYASGSPTPGMRTVSANFDNATIDENGKVVTGPELWWSAIDNSTLQLVSSADAGMGNSGGLVLGQVGEQFDAEPSGSFVTSLADLGVDNMQVGDELSVRFTIYFPNLAGDDPGFDRYRLGIFETTSSNTFGIGNSFSPGAGVTRARISFFKETYDDQDNPGFLSKEDPITFEDLVFGGDTPFASDDVTVNGYLGNGEPHTYQLHLLKVPNGMEVTTIIDDGVVEFSGLIPNATRNFTQFGAFRFWMRDGSSPTSAQAFFINDFEATYNPIAATDDPFMASTDAVEQDDGSFLSPWFGSYTRLEDAWIRSNTLGLLWIDLVENPFSMWMWSGALENWIWTAEAVYPQIFVSGENSWYFVFHVEGIGTYVYDYDTRTWSELSLE